MLPLATAAGALAEGFGAASVALPRVLLQSDDDSILGPLLFFGVGLFLVYDGFQVYQRMQLMTNTPTEKVRSAAAGRTELKGTARPTEGTIERPFTDGDCLVADWKIEEWEEDDDDSGGNWKTVDSGTWTTPFGLDDDTGTMRVEPPTNGTYEISDDNRWRTKVGRTESEPPGVREFLREETSVDVPSSGVSGAVFGEKRRYTQEVVPPNADVYALGGARTRQDRDGGSNADLLVLERDEGSEEFVLSDMSEDELVSKYKWRAPAEIAGGVLLSAFMLYQLLTMVGL